MTVRLIEVVVCDLCKQDRRAVAHREIDVCERHDQQLEERFAEAAHICRKCGKSFGTVAGLRIHEGQQGHQPVEG